MPLFQDAITNNVCKLTKLRHLDISRFSVGQGNNLFPPGEYKNPNQVLRAIDKCLPRLVSLDLSGTNLAGTGTFEYNLAEEAVAELEEAGGMAAAQMPQCDVPGLVSRAGRPLNFLGLYKTSHDACYRAHIPAAEVSNEHALQNTTTS